MTPRRIDVAWIWKTLLSLLYGTEQARFESCHPLAEAVARLQAASVASSWPAPPREALHGSVAHEDVQLDRLIPSMHNPFKPVFVGRFEQHDTRVALVGGFTIHWFIKAFMTLWLLGCACMSLVSAAMVLGSAPDKWYFPLAGLGMFALGCLFIAAGKAFAREDIAWMSRRIGAALSTDDAPPAAR